MTTETTTTAMPTLAPTGHRDFKYRVRRVALNATKIEEACNKAAGYGYRLTNTVKCNDAVILTFERPTRKMDDATAAAAKAAFAAQPAAPAVPTETGREVEPGEEV